MTPANLVFIFRSPPYSTPTAAEGIDALLAAAIFDQKISVIFMGDGVFQLNSGQAPVDRRNQTKMLQSLAMYDIDQVFVQASALEDRGMSSTDVGIACTAISDQAIHQVIAAASHVLSF